ncbi:MAG TPA: tetratricopeptide repeat protein [Thermoanaerobaculia bacterium]|jgi:serine/threonine-protein kinase|nr:tetratricopeptide repeat protein [Thermoanaerobaculia bacterium]
MRFKHWNRVKEILEAVEGLPAEERIAYISMACAGNEILRHEVEKLLSADLGRVSFLETRHPYVLSSPLEQGDRIGAYSIVSELGRGGMGTVYLAIRADAEFEGQVAIKLLHPVYATPEIEWRFQQEIQILANLNHPNIAKLYEVGRTEKGIPYIIMEPVDGLPITHFCIEHNLSIADRLKLFQKICGAVEYAHQNLVVHRDLKPSNILVTPDGEPKLLDFGIAKLLQSTDSPDPVTVTRLRFFTPDYASPEQVSGQKIATASDVYSLGVLLYELLTGSLPYSLKGHTEEEVRQIVCEQEPEIPSRTSIQKFQESAEIRLSRGEGRRKHQSRRLHRQLQGDLDKIIMMALRKEPSRRYRSVEQLAGDIDAHLKGFPVSAQRDSWKYRTIKFLRRHRLAATVTAAVFFLSLGFGISMWFQQQKTARERDKFEQVSNLLVNLFEVADPAVARGKKVSLVELLKRGTLRIRSELRKQPEVQATLFEKLGTIYIQLALPKEAMELCNESRRIREHLFGRQHAEVGSALTCLGDAALTQGDFSLAEQYLKKALQIAHGRTQRSQKDRVVALSNLAWAIHLQNRNSEAEALLKEALELDKKLPEREPAVLTNLAQVYDDRGQYGEAEKLFRQAIDLFQSKVGRDHPLTVEAMNYLGVVLDHAGKLDEALRVYTQTLSLQRQLYGEDHPKVAGALNNIGLMLLDQENFALAEAYLRQAVEIHRRTDQTPTPSTAIALSNLGKALSKLGRLTEAEASIREALALFQESLPKDHLYIAFCLSDLAENLASQRRLPEAEDIFRKALHVSSATADNRADPLAAGIIRNYGRFLARDKGDMEAAVPVLREALDTFRKRLQPGHWYIADAQNYLGSVLLKMGRCQEAKPLLLESHQGLKASLGDKSPRTKAAADWLKKLADCREGRPTRRHQSRP